MLTLTEASDAPSEAWGGLIRTPGSPKFSAIGDFPEEWASCHINVKEAYALLEILKLFCKENPRQLAGTRTVMDVDSKTLYLTFRKGSARNSTMHAIWLQVNEEFTLELRWVSSAANKEADDLTKQAVGEHVRLTSSAFARIWEIWGGGDMDLIATPASAQWAPASGNQAARRLPFYSRHNAEGSSGMDVLI